MRKKRISPQQIAAEYIKAERDQEELSVRETEDKGRGIFAGKEISSGEFIAQYAGELISGQDGEKREKETGSVFRYFFTYKGIYYCIDATLEPEGEGPTVGRLVNHGDDHEMNSTMKVVWFEEKPHLCIFAIRNITAGTEILYSYGVKNLPWKTKPNNTHTQRTTICTDQSRIEKEASTDCPDNCRPAPQCEYDGRWAASVHRLMNDEIGQQEVGQNLKINKSCKIATGSEGAEVFLGLFEGSPVSVKRKISNLLQKEDTISQALKSANTSNILPLLHCAADENFTYLVTPLCEYNLQELIEDESCQFREKLTGEEKYTLCLEFLQGMKELHDVGILHRDLKPSNLLLDNTGKLLIADFGISRQLFGSTSLFTNAMGTMCWMAAEAIGSGSVKYKKSSDIQVAGCILYYILSDGHSPFESIFPFSLDPFGLMRNRADNCFKLNHLGSDFTDLCDVISQMLNHGPENRPNIDTCIYMFQGHTVQTKDANSGAEIDANSGAEIDANSGAEIDANSGAEIDANSGAEIDANSGAEIDANSGAEIDANSGAEIDANSGAEIDANSGAEIDANSGAEIDANSSAEIDANSGADANSSAEIDANSGAEIDANSGADANSSAEIDANSGAEIDANSGAEIDAKSGAEIDANSGADASSGAEIDANSGAEIDANSGAEIDANSSAEIDANSGAEIDANSGAESDISSGAESDISSGAESDGNDADNDYRPSDGSCSKSDTGSGNDSDSYSDDDSGGMSGNASNARNANASDTSDASGTESDTRSGTSSETSSGTVSDTSSGTDSDASSSDEDDCPKETGMAAASTSINKPSTNSNHVDETETYVLASSYSPGKKRVWDKYAYCVFCCEKQSKIHRHLKRKHSDEVQVANVLNTDDKRRRKRIWSKLIKLGNYNHNDRVDDGKSKDLIVSKRPRKGRNVEVDDYIACSWCYGHYHVYSLWQHRRYYCPEKTRTPTKGTRHVAEGRKMKTKPGAAKGLQKVMEKMVCDDLARIAKSDRYIRLVGEITHQRSNSSKVEYLSSQKMRHLAKVLREARKNNMNVICAADLVKASSFDTVVSATLRIADYDEESRRYIGSHSMVLKVGYALNDLAVAVRGTYLKSVPPQADKAADVDNFMKLKEGEWLAKVSAAALRQRQERSWKEPVILPLTKDVVDFNNFLDKESKEIRCAMTKEGCTEVRYKRLAQLTLAKVVVFNRRRPHEVEEVEVEDYIKQIENPRPVQDEIAKALSVSEKVAMKRLKIIMVRGKGGRGVPMLIAPELKRSMDMLASYNKGRKYLFSRASLTAATAYRATDVLRELTVEADLQNPENIRCTKLRKHIASLSQLLGLKKHELEQLARHMGHNIDIHREYYRLPQETLLLAKMSKLLRVVEKGQLHTYAGMSLEDIEISENETLDVNPDEDDDEEEEEGEERVGASPEEVDASPEEVDAPPEANRQPENVGRKTCKVRSKISPWNTDETKFLMMQTEIKAHLRNKTAPTKLLAEILIKRSKGILKNKTWHNIKDKIHNKNMAEKARIHNKEIQRKRQLQERKEKLLEKQHQKKIAMKQRNKPRNK